MTLTLLLAEDTVLRISPVYTVFCSLCWHILVGLDTGGAGSGCPAQTAQFFKLDVSQIGCFPFLLLGSYLRGNE